MPERNEIERLVGMWNVIVVDLTHVGVGDVARTLLTFGTALPILAASLPFRAIGVGEKDAHR